MLSGAMAAGQTGKGKKSTFEYSIFPLQILLLLNQNTEKNAKQELCIPVTAAAEAEVRWFLPQMGRRHRKIH